MRQRRTGVMAVVIAGALVSSPAVAATGGQEPPNAHDEALTVVTEDPVLKQQIVKVHAVLEGIYEEMAQQRQAIQQTMDEASKAALYERLDGVRRERDLLEQLLHELVDEARATEWTTIDEALMRARAFERYQERAAEREEAIRERKL